MNPLKHKIPNDTILKVIFEGAPDRLLTWNEFRSERDARSSLDRAEILAAWRVVTCLQASAEIRGGTVTLDSNEGLKP